MCAASPELFRLSRPNPGWRPTSKHKVDKFAPRKARAWGAGVTSMTEMRESSVLFSLNQLMNLEQQRLREEEDAARRKAEAEAAARSNAERRLREEQQARIVAEENRRRAEEVQRREQAARLEAIRLAELERVRIDAERQERLAMMEQAQDHERKVAALTQDRQKKRLTRT